MTTVKSTPMEILRWRCRNGHTLGLVERRGNGRHVLLLFRWALADLTPGPSPHVERGENQGEVEVMALVEGTMLEVRCSVCGEVRSWWSDGRPKTEDRRRRPESTRGAESTPPKVKKDEAPGEKIRKDGGKDG